MLRHLPPTAAPLDLSDLRHGLSSLSRGAEAIGGFAEALAGYLEVPVCRLAASGRTALFLLLQALVREPELVGRREVVLPAYTCPAVAKVAMDVGLRPRLVDILPAAYGMDLERLAGTIGGQTLAVVHVHPFGLPQSIAPVLEMAGLAGAVVIEDAAQALGARLQGRAVGTHGDFGLYSLGPGKPLSLGGGGVASLNRERYAASIAAVWRDLPVVSAGDSILAEARLAMMALAFHPRGWWLMTRAGLHRVGDREESWGYRMAGLTPSQAAIGCELLPRLDEANRQRRRNAKRLTALLSGLDDVELPTLDPAAEPIYLRLPVLVRDEARCAVIYQRLWDAGIGVGRMYRQPLAAIFPDLGPVDAPGAELVARSLLTLPTHHYLTDDDVARIGEAFADRTIH